GTSLRALPGGRHPIPAARPGPAHQQMLPIAERWHQNRLRQQPPSAAPARLGQMPGAKLLKKAGKKPGTRKRGFQVYAWAPRRYEGKLPRNQASMFLTRDPRQRENYPMAGGDEVTLGRAPALTTEDTENTEENKTISCVFTDTLFLCAPLCPPW